MIPLQNGSIFADAGREKSAESQNETAGLLQPPDAIPRSPSSEAVEKV